MELTLAELGVEYATHNVNLAANAQRGGNYRSVNPQGKLRSLDSPDGGIMTESVAIFLALLDNHPGHQLLPMAGTRERAQAMRWLLFVATELYPIVENNDYPKCFCANSADGEPTREIERSIWRNRWLVVE